MALVIRRFRLVVLLVLTGSCKADSYLFQTDRVADYDPPAELSVPASDLVEVSFRAGADTLYGFYFHHTGTDGYPRTVLLSHGRNGNVARPPEWSRATAIYFGGFDVLAYDYRGYGRSTGTSVSEATIDSDATAALAYLQGTLGVPDSELILYGHSIGATPTLALAERVGGGSAVVLESAFTSAQEMARTATLVDAPVSWFLRGSFDNIDQLPRIHLPVLILHGTLDPEVPVSQAAELYARAGQPKYLKIFPRAAHDDISEQPDFADALYQLGLMTGVVHADSRRPTSGP
ncbi:MAG TPA: alpha/beta fold hydrolase [Gemmatimonadales bacterium]|jgi:hypothetical protein